MKKNVTPGMIEWISRNWEDPRNAGEVQEMIEAIVAELKQDYRAWQRHHRATPEEVAEWERLIADAQDKCFWDNMDYLLHFNFDY